MRICEYTNMIIHILIILCFINCTKCIFYKENITDFSKCKVHYSRLDNLYKNFYRIDDQAEIKNKPNDTLLDFHFSVLAISDAHILLSPSSQIDTNDPVYEIVIGAGGNTFSDIRRKMKSNVRASVRVRGVLSPVDVRSFWIHIYKDGVIDVGKEGEELGFLSWKDPDVLPIEVFSFGTWGDVEAKWFFDCPRRGKTTNSTEIEPVLTSLEILRKDLLTGYDPYVRPVYNESDVTIIFASFISNFLSVDEKTGVLNLKGRISLSWEDEKLKWVPKKYGGIESIHIQHGEIWKPALIILDSTKVEGTDTLYEPLMVVSKDGLVSWQPSLNSYTFCNISSLGSWPEDTHSCTIRIAFGSYKDQLELQFHESKSSFFSQVVSNEWEVTEVVITSNYELKQLEEFFESEAVTIVFKISRVSGLYKQALFSPFIAIITSMFVSFYCSPFGSMKTSLVCLQLILNTMVLVGLLVLIPGGTNKLPFLVYLYCGLMVINVLRAIMIVIVINIARIEKKYYLPYTIRKLLISMPLKCVLLLPEVKHIYWASDFNEMQFTSPKMQEAWIHLSVALDRIFCWITVMIVAALYFAY